MRNEILKTKQKLRKYVRAEARKAQTFYDELLSQEYKMK